MGLSRFPLLFSAILALLPTAVVSQTALAAKRFNYTNLPYQADTDNGVRGRQTGYNICNSTTEGPTSLCQTAIINSIDDFCLWGPPEPNSTVGDTEGEMVAYCTKEGHGSRRIPAGALQGVQFMRTPHYVQVTGFINQAMINVEDGDTGGEMDPHGADQRGNPLGGLLFSTAFSGNTTTNGTAGNARYQQVIQWHNFLGSSTFCLKACDPSYELGYRLCEHIYDRIGCKYNAPSTNPIGVFESCLGEDQLPPGIYVGSDNITSTYTQPPESLGPITSIPYEPSIPKSSSCTPYESNNIYLVASTSSSLPASTSTTSAASTTSTTSSATTTSTTATSSAASETRTTTSGATHDVARLLWIVVAVALGGFFVHV